MELEAAVTQAAITPDGVQLTLMGNVDLPDEIIPAARNDAQGVGLLRTEFLVTGRAALPTEDEQSDYFRRVSDAFPGLPVVIRSFDLGGDKFPAAFRAPPEANPFLGWRSIRVCLDQPEIFRPQLRAVLRAAADRPAAAHAAAGDPAGGGAGVQGHDAGGGARPLARRESARPPRCRSGS